MKHCSLFCAGWWPFLLLPLLLLAVVLFFEQRSIESHVAENTQASLTAIDADWAEIETHNRGRDVLLSGSPPSLAAVNAALEKARDTEGVRVVELSSDVSTPEVATSIAPANDPTLNAVVYDGKIELTGTLASQAAIDSVVSQASNTFGAANVINRLKIGGNTADLLNITGLFGALKGKASAVTMNMTGESMTVTGEMPNSPTKVDTLSAVRSAFSGTVVDRLTIVPPPPPAALPKIEHDVCEETISSLLSNAKINFDTGKSTISADSFDLLKEIIATAKRCDDASFEVSGHTDSTGSLEGNMRLSEQRAQAVVDYLLQAGLPSSQFTAAGYGPNKPLADNNTQAGRSANRRIEFRLKN